MQRTSNANELRDLIERGQGINNGGKGAARDNVPVAGNTSGSRIFARK